MAATRTDTSKKRMLEALEKSLGVVTTAAKMAGIERKTHYRWMDKDSKYREAVDNISNVVLDFAESQLHQQIKKGNTAATIFLLKTIGKKRGYIERQEVDHNGGINSTLIEWKPAELKE